MTSVVPIRVLLVEDHASLRQALEAVIALEDDLEVVGHVARGDLVEEAVDTSRPDVAVVDLDLPGASGIEVLEVLRDRDPPVTCLVLTALTDEPELGRAVEAGAAGVLHKSAEVPELLAAIRSVAGGANLLDPSLTSRWLRSLGRRRDDQWRARVTRDALSPREQEILVALAGGATVAAIAATLGIAADTVETHIRNLRGKLGASSRLEAVVIGLRLGLVEPPEGTGSS